MKKSAKLIVVMLSLLAGAAAAATFPFTANGSWTVPAGVASITIEVWGGGGAGGGNTTTGDGGGGGGGGAYSRTANIAVTPGEVCTVTVGIGGSGVTGAAGLAGGQTSVLCSGGASVLAAGGAGGLPPVGSAGGVGGAGGAAGGGAISFSGGSGGTGRNNNTGRGGPGGSSAGNAANGTPGPNPWVTLIAAAPPMGGGIGGNGGNSGQNGFAPASGNGGGGGGSGDRTFINRTGGNGAGGKAIISYATAPIVTTTAATALLSDGATLNGIVDDGGADTAITFEYGLTTAYGSTAVATPSPLPANSGSTVVSAVVSGLACNTTYHFRATGVNSAGAGYGGDLTFATAACPPLMYVFTDSVCQDGVAFGTPGQCALVAWSPRTAGQALGNIYLTYVTLVGGNLVPTRVSTTVRTRTMLFGLSCHDPVANAGVQATLSYQSLLTPVTVALPLCQGGGAQPTIGSAAWSTGVLVTFPASSPSSDYPFSFNYDDVGKVELWINRSGRTDLGYTGPFVVKPAGFALSDIRQTAAPNLVNPAAADAAGLKFVKAGEAFSVTVTALTVSGKVKADAGTAINCATIPADCTPNYGNEISPESVQLTPALAGLGLTNNPALGGSFGSFGSDCAGAVDPAWAARACGTAFTWNEVGIITLTPHVGDLDYLAAGDVVGTTTGNVGRFTLAKLALQNIALVNRADYCQGGFGVTLCTPAFTYMGEQIDAEFTLRPQSLNGTPVLNYVDSATVANDFAKFDPTIFADLNLAAVDRTTAGGPYYLSARISNTAMPAVSCTTTPCFQAGSADVTVPFAFSRAAEDGPYGPVEVGIGLAESDGARVEGTGATPGLCNNPNESDCYDLDSDAVAGNDRARLGATEFRYGRIKVSNAYGSELLPLTLVATAQYYMANGWINSITDTVTDLNVAASYAVGTGASSTTVTPASGILNNGSLSILLAKPSGGATGVATVAPTVVGCVDPATCYLPVTAGTATFGVYKSKNPFIYRRETY